jgi:hypothetical protein
VIQEAIEFGKDDLTPAAVCEQCGQPFEPRAGSGGERQRFCGQDCRRKFHRHSHRPPTVFPPLPTYTLETPFEVATQPTEKDAPAPTVKAQGFDWTRSEVLLQPVPMTAPYIDPDTGDLVIGQDGRSSYQDDTVVRIPADHIAAFIDRLTDVLGIFGAKP